MTEANDRFAELARRGHEVFTAAVQAWEQAARSLAEAARRPEGSLPDIRASVDAAFDFAARMLADQREFTKTVMSLGSQVVTATTQRAAQVIEPAAITASDDSPGTGAGTSTVESSPGAVGADGQQATAETAVVAVSPARDDSATKTPAIKTPDTKTPDTKTPEARKTAAKKTPAARKTAAKKTATPTAARATAAKKTPAPTAARATAAKKTTAPAAEKTPAAETPPAETTPPAEKTPAAEKTTPAETPAPAKRSAPAERAAGSGNGDRA
jgi:hypothetical protein